MKKKDLQELEELITKGPFDPGVIVETARKIGEFSTDNINKGKSLPLQEIAKDIGKYFRVPLMTPEGMMIYGQKGLTREESFRLNIPSVIYLHEQGIPSRWRTFWENLDEMSMIGYFRESPLREQTISYLKELYLDDPNTRLVLAESIIEEQGLLRLLIEATTQDFLSVKLARFETDKEGITRVKYFS